MRAELVADAVQMAVWRRRPPKDQTVAHSDHGGAYTSWLLGTRLRNAGLLGSMGTVGDCFDNSVAEAFFSNPAHIYFCPDEGTRLAKLEWLLGGNLKLQSDLSMSFCLADGNIVDAMGFWTRSSAPRIGTMQKIRAGLLEVPFRFGWKGMQRIFELTGAVEHQLERTLGRRPYWYLNNMVVRESLRGTGIGSRLLREQLEIVAGDEPTYAIALSTQKPENVVFYQRLGFSSVLDEVIGRGPRAFRTWIMVR
jgi:GNAT superfamily N-acetyltransferase